MLLTTKKHYSELTSDDFVFFKAGGKWNKVRGQFSKVDELLDGGLREAWRNRKDKGKKHARKAFMKEHVLPVIRIAYFCNDDGSLTVLSPYGIAEKVASKLREKNSVKMKETKLVTYTPSSINSFDGAENVAVVPSNYEGVSYVSGSDVDDDVTSEFSLVDFAGEVLELIETMDPEDDVGILTDDECNTLALPLSTVVNVHSQLGDGESNRVFVPRNPQSTDFHLSLQTSTFSVTRSRPSVAWPDRFRSIAKAAVRFSRKSMIRRKLRRMRPRQRSLNF